MHVETLNLRSRSKLAKGSRYYLHRRPSELLSTDHVNVQVVDRLAALNAVVDHHTVAVTGDALLGGHLSRHAQQSTQDLVV